MTDTNISMVRGDTLSFGVEYDGTEQDLDAAYFTVRDSVNSSQITLQKTLGYGITKSDTGKYVVRVAPNDTNIIPAGAYYYDLQAELNGDVFTLLKGALIIEQDITQITQ